MSQSLTLLSSLADSKVFPSAKKSTDLTGAVCPLIVLVLILDPGNHNLMVLSYEALAKIF